jgi:hypothetical protein
MATYLFIWKQSPLSELFPRSEDILMQVESFKSVLDFHIRMICQPCGKPPASIAQLVSCLLMILPVPNSIVSFTKHESMKMIN